MLHTDLLKTKENNQKLSTGKIVNVTELWRQLAA
jgi:hypothetical protein